MATRHQNHRLLGNLNALETLQIALSRLDARVQLLPQVAYCFLLQFCQFNLPLNLAEASKFIVDLVDLAFPEIVSSLQFV